MPVLERYNGYKVGRNSYARDLAGRRRPPNTARFVPGPPGVSGGILIEEADMPLYCNPFFGAVVQSGSWPQYWSKDWSGVNSPTPSVYRSGDRWILRSTSTGDTKCGVIVNLGVVNSPTITLSVKVRASKARNVNVVLYDFTSGSAIASLTYPVSPSGFTQLAIPPQAFVSGHTLTCYIRIYEGAVLGDWVEVCEPMISTKPYHLSFVENSRAAEVVPLDGSGLTPASFAVEWMMNITDVVKRQVVNQWPSLIRIPGVGSAGGVFVTHQTAGSATFYVGSTNDSGSSKSANVADSAIPNGWHRCGLCCNGSVLEWIVDNVTLGSVDSPLLPSAFGSSIFLGVHSNGNYHANTEFADVRISRQKPQTLATKDAPAPFVPGETIRIIRFDGPAELYVPSSPERWDEQWQ